MLFLVAATNAPVVSSGAADWPRMRGPHARLREHLAEEITAERSFGVVDRHNLIAGDYDGGQTFFEFIFVPASGDHARFAARRNYGGDVDQRGLLPAVGAMKACSGAAGSEGRTKAVKIAESATARSTSPTKGNVETSSVR
jgi:hypothetical protein